ncbi:GNAT family N-acetyltransferase [Tropicimonas isoalkanivorans]|uniref:Protein N-acetyltransferase, RimJ/RimL family n=1 Tax=Tropicimonas isoalkanivorans TaxID=441112 RepID=A0A1I1JZN0_9RHOB|nr:GNAT family N-acetyltransferase [Tropicimonas isoalkanivorans]SFC50840.1 Protein N-acetyltransferase, RimJ/RimL family [Tropicimonas isoalkanivorans]
MRAPVLETTRLFLRRPTQSDIGSLLARLRAGAPRLSTAPLCGPRALAQTVPIVCQWDLCGTGLFAVLAKGCDEPLGLAGPWHATGWQEPELGWLFWDTADADTLAPEAVHAARDFAARGLGWREIVSLVDAEDRRSAALARSCGAIGDPFCDDGTEALVFRHPVPARSGGWRRAA